MNEVVIVIHTCDILADIIDTAMKVVKVKNVSYVVFTFNDCKLFVKKDSTKESIYSEYNNKINNR